jgi:hypothetical protein
MTRIRKRSGHRDIGKAKLTAEARMRKIAGIARHRRNRKGKVSPRRRGDAEKIGRSQKPKTYRGFTRINADQEKSEEIGKHGNQEEQMAERESALVAK